MRASLDQARDVALDAVDAARIEATRLLEDGAASLVTLIDAGTDSVGASVDRLVERAPNVSIEVTKRGSRRRRAVVVLVIVVVGAIGLAVMRRSVRAHVREGVTGAEATGTLARSSDSRSTRSRFEVRPVDTGGWDVTGPEGTPVQNHYDTQAHGIERAHALATEAGGGEIVIHGLDGKPRDTRTVAPPVA